VRVAIVRARHSAVYPARFTLVGATNPCPCGYAGEAERCRCSEADIARHRRRLSGPLLDRIDLLVNMQRVGPAELRGAPIASSAHARELVVDARERQAARFREEGILVNAHMDARMAREHARLDDTGERMLADSIERGLLSTRGQQRALRIARTLADLAGSERIRSSDVSDALALRPDSGPSARRAA